MKLIFKKEDTIFKIFSTIEKLNTNQKVEIYIHPENPFFQNKWWLKQLIKILDKNGINYIFICELKNQSFFKSEGIECKLKNDILSIIYRHINYFFNKIKTFHYNILNPKSILGKIIIIIEILFLIGLGYSFYKFISFEANIYIREAKDLQTIVYNFLYYPYGQHITSEKLSISYIIGSGTISKTLNINVKDIKYTITPSSGKVTIYNYTPNTLSFRANTKFVTQDGLLFKSPTWFSIPGKKGDKPGKTTINLIALDKDINGNLIGAKGNIKKGTKLYILKFPLSKDKKLIIAEAVNDFKGGQTNAIGIVNQEDINYLKNTLKDELEKNKLLLLKQNIKKDQIIILPFDDLISYDNIQIKIDGKPGEQKVQLQGTITAQIKYYYILFNDFVKTVGKYFQQRPIDSIKVEQINKDSIKFLEKIDIKPGIFAITTQFDVIKGYNFEQDKNNIIQEIKTKIVGKTKNEAEKIILSYPQISSVEIKISPPWYNILPKLKSKIKFHIVK